MLRRAAACVKLWVECRARNRFCGMCRDTVCTASLSWPTTHSIRRCESPPAGDFLDVATMLFHQQHHMWSHCWM